MSSGNSDGAPTDPSNKQISNYGPQYLRQIVNGTFITFVNFFCNKIVMHIHLMIINNIIEIET